MSDAIIAALSRIEAKLDRLLSAPTGERPSKDQEVRKDPKSWKGGSYAGRMYSECPPDYLEELAGLFDWMATKDDESGARGETDPRGNLRSGKWKRADAALARGWAAYLRVKGGAARGGAPKAAPADAFDGDAIPF